MQYLYTILTRLRGRYGDRLVREQLGLRGVATMAGGRNSSGVKELLPLRDKDRGFRQEDTIIVSEI